MPISPARAAAFRILQRVDSSSVFAADLLHSNRLDALSDRDRRLATELVMGVLRWQGDIDFQIERLSRKPAANLDREVLEALRLGIYQIRYLQDVPVRAAVHESVEIVKQARKRSAAAFVNAILRRCSRERPRQEDRIESARRSFPPWLIERWRRNLGAETDTLLIASVSAPRTYFRPAAGDVSREDLAAELQQDGVATSPADYAPRALRVMSGNLHASAAWRERRAVIQDEGSQLVAELLAPRPGHAVLDLCAAPGMKAAQIAAEMRSGAYIACDSSERRLRTMRKLVSGAWPRGITLHSVCLDASRLLPFTAAFDRVLVDAPCSGTGTLARNPEIKWRLRPADITRHAGRQRLILKNALSALRPGGRLVYATCSLEPEENEEVVGRALDGFAGFHALGAAQMKRAFPAMAGLFDASGAFRSIPGVQAFDGFYAAVIERLPGAC